MRPLVKTFTHRPRSLPQISESTVRRLSHYYRVLEEVEAEGKRVISSRRLAEREGITSAQVRKDLSCFGSFGRRGLGYDVAHLREEIRAILGLERRWRVAVVGAGNVGAALIAYRGFEKQGFDVVAVFDREPARIGVRLGTLVVQDVAVFAAAAARERFEIGVIATPVRAAQEVADLLVAAGVRGILNFAPRKLFVPPHVALRTVDMAMEFESLSFTLARTLAPRRRQRG
jgi:redox-sensing transcriptional repressor